MINKITLIGRLGANPAINATNANVNVANFSLATTQSWKDKNTGEKKERTQWHRITTFRHQADFVAKYLGKGDLVYIEGMLDYRNYKDQNGIERTVAEIIAEKVNILHSNRQAQAGAEPSTQPQP